MTHKILVADDSLTVQKVVSITLASYDYELIECKDESQLNEQLIIGGASLLLLDLNLSENKTGYQVAKEAKAKFPELPIILLLGTFDSVDEEKFNASGLSDRIVKPFESSSFIQKIQSLLESNASDDSGSIFSGETESNFLENDVEEITLNDVEDNSNGDGWVVDSPSPVDKSSESWDSFSQGSKDTAGNPLTASLEGWGMNVPGPIGNEQDEMNMDLPGVIATPITTSTVSSEGLEIIHEEEKKIPVASDLDYPELDEIEAIEQNVSKEIDHKPTSAFLTTDEFNLDEADDDEEYLEKTDPQFTLPTEELSSAIEDEEEADDFWAADESSGEELSLADDIEDDLEEEFHAEPDEGQTDEVILEGMSLEPQKDSREYEPFNIESPREQNISLESSSPINKDEIVAKIIEDIKPLISELIEKHCVETIENVAWQIIPDLAENLIRSEIKEIKENSQSL
ncbi:MAG: CheY-like chemotaxis protein [Bacteriovoracaceae bacterium]|jgi:CheY-like chemotaxis protein